ncbi:Hypothetical predicted protein [Cloeon dipterum]|uniref:Uncharacterized protein n=1 Tax=Cloeon dipterum TaxID=197152 RepID=A0A8S1CB99_9INSE|nr:Hypothetical predicted protein [Cloeon dipterum]
MEIARLENEYSTLQAWENRYLDDLSAMQLEILKLEQQEKERLLSVEASPNLQEKILALSKVCFQCASTQGELLKEEKSLKEFQISQLQEESSKLGQNRAAATARATCLKKQLLISKHFNKSLEKKWKDMTKCLSSVKSAMIKWDSSPCTSYLDQRLKDKEADLGRLQRQRCRLEEMKRSVATNSLPNDLPSMSDAVSVSEFETDSTPLCRAIQENIALTMEKQHLEQQSKSLAARKLAQIEHLERAKEELNSLKEKLKISEETQDQFENCEKFLEQLDKETEMLDAHCCSLQQQVDVENEKIHTVKNEIIQLLAQSAVEKEIFSVEARELEKIITANKLELNQLQDRISVATKERNALKERNTALVMEYEEICSSDEIKELLEKKTKESEEINQLQTRIKQQKSAQLKMATNIDELQGKIALLAKDVATVTEQGDKLLNSNRSQMSSLQAEISTLESDLLVLTEASLKMVQIA